MKDENNIYNTLPSYVSPPCPPKKNMSVEQIIALVEDMLPFTKEDHKCMQKQMIKQRNRALLERIIKTVKEDPYVIYKFEVK